MNTRFERAVSSSFSYLLYQITCVVSSLLLPGMILRAYGSAVNGTIASITQLFSFFAVLQAGIQGSSRVVLYSSMAANDIEKTSSIMAANSKYYKKLAYILIAYIAILAVLLSYNTKDGVASRDVVFLVLIIGITYFIQYYFGYYYKALLAADQAIYVLNYLELLSIVLNLVFAWIVISLDGTPVHMKLLCSLAYVANPVILNAYVKAKYKLNTKATPDYSALVGRWDVLANSVANSIHENVDIVCLSIFSSPKEISVYSIYHLIISGLFKVMQVMSSGIEPAFGNMWVKKEKGSFESNFYKFEFLVYFTTGIAFSCLIVLILPFISLYTSSIDDVNYVRSGFAIICSLSFASQCIRVPYITIVQAVGHYKQTKVGSFIEAGINALLSLILVQFYGINGVVFATLIANLFRSIQYGFYIFKNVIVKNPIIMVRRLGWLISTAILCILFIGRLLSLIHITNWIMWGSMGFVCVVISFLIFSFSAYIFYRSDLKNVVMLLRNYVKKRRVRQRFSDYIKQKYS